MFNEYYREVWKGSPSVRVGRPIDSTSSLTRVRGRKETIIINVQSLYGGRRANKTVASGRRRNRVFAEPAACYTYNIMYNNSNNNNIIMTTRPRRLCSINKYPAARGKKKKCKKKRSVVETQLMTCRVRKPRITRYLWRPCTRISDTTRKTCIFSYHENASLSNVFLYI